MTQFDDLFGNAKFNDDFGWSSEWNIEVEKWLTFVKQKDGDYYKSHKKRARSDKQRDELLGEYKAAYFIEKKVGCKIVEFEPEGQNGKKLDFSFEDINGTVWFAEVKSPSWRNEVAKEIENQYLKSLKERLTFNGLNQESGYTKWNAEFTCPLCGKKSETEIGGVDVEDEAISRVVTDITCRKCKKHVWKSLESKRVQEINQRLSKPQFISGEGRWFDGSEAVEDAIRKSVRQFEQGKNNLLIITPNMFADAVLMPAMDGGHKVKQLLQKYDKDNLISCVLVLEVSLPSSGIVYTDIFVPAKNKKPAYKNKNEQN